MNGFRRWLLWTSSALTGVTGIVYWWMDTMMEPVEAWAVINHPLQPVVLKAHILVAPVLVFAVGLVAADHIWRHYRQKVAAGRRSGLAAMWVFVPMVVTGYLIQAVTHAGWLEALAWTHLGAGTIYLAGLVAHHRVMRNVPGRRSVARPGPDPSASRGVAVERGSEPAPRRMDRRLVPRRRGREQAREQVQLQ